TELPTFGFASSPLLDGDSLYVQAGCAVTKLDANSGETVWRALENRQAMFGSAFSSPVIATLHGTRQLIAQTRSSLGGIDLETGEVLWSTPVKAFRGMNILTPEVIGNRVFTATYGGGSTMFDVEKEGDGFRVSSRWNDEKLEGYMASPIVIDDHIYLLGRDQHFHCIRADDGTVMWRSDEKFGQYWSMVANGTQLLALDQKGELLLMEASPKAFEMVSRKKLSKQATWAHVGVSDDLILIRPLNGMAVYRWE
ncbi:MAG: PQQ-binding-like beta-propeller repeat protein, partial [Verrucomicrobiota bacterium]